MRITKGDEPMETEGKMNEQMLATETADVLMDIGRRVRHFRLKDSMTLKMLSAATGLSTSMLSLVERGLSSPSIGSLITICSALGIQMSDLVVSDQSETKSYVSRKAEQPTITSGDGSTRRILRDDKRRGIEVAINEYQMDSGNSEQPLGHAGYEYGVLIEGRLIVEVGTSRYELMPGDLISYDSRIPHKIWNYDKKPARTLWINHDRNK